jgi:hypothetical protein
LKSGLKSLNNDNLINLVHSKYEKLKDIPFELKGMIWTPKK